MTNLRPYQHRAIDDLRNAYRSGARAPIDHWRGDVTILELVSLERQRVDSSPEPHRSGRFGRHPVRVDVARPVVERRSCDEIQMRL